MLIIWAFQSYTYASDKKSTKGYEILVFDSANGIFDPKMSKEQQQNYMHLWKRARKYHYILNPDNEHGRECGTHAFLKADKIVKSNFLKDYTIFLISPGLRPCDYDEKCKKVSSIDKATCAHTQFLKNYPVFIDPNGTPYHEYSVNIPFINALLESEKIKIINEQQALQLIQFVTLLTEPMSEITDTKTMPESGRRFKIVLKLKVPVYDKLRLREYVVDSTGKITVLTEK